MAVFESNVISRFPQGTEVLVFPRLTDVFNPGGMDPVDRMEVDESGDVKFSGLQADAPYWLAGRVGDDWRSIGFTATGQNHSRMGIGERAAGDESRAQVQREREARAKMFEEFGPQVASAAPGGRANVVGAPVVTGPRSAADVKRDLKERHQEILVSELGRDTPKDDEVQPHPNQVDVKGVKQRSDTAFGEATPKPDPEPQPIPSQDQVKKGTPQRSDTEFGEATVKNEDEVQPQIRQDKAPKSLRQRSSTPEGAIVPKPEKASKAGVEDARKAGDSSFTNAAGGSAEQPAEATSRREQKDDDRPGEGEIKATKADR